MTARENASGNAPHIDLAVAITCDYWNTLDFSAEDVARDAMMLTFAMADTPAVIKGSDLEFSVVLTDDETIAALNRDYRGKDQPTNVLSFAALDAAEDADFTPPQAGQAWAIGDVILAFETIEREALEQNKSMRDHFAHLVVHGTLHLLGYDHEDSHEADIMESLEIRILKKYGVKNPYSDTQSVA